MTPRPPTMREKRRYILVRVDPAGTTIDQKELYYAISDAITALWGDSAAAIVNAAVVAAEEGHVIVRCQRGTERELAIALSTVTGYRDLRLALRLVAASGTMESLRARFRKTKQPVPAKQPVPDEACPAGAEAENGEREAGFAGKKFMIAECEGGKVDVIEKGFKNANRLFLTTEDLEVP